jgi:hypothetical protein
MRPAPALFLVCLYGLSAQDRPGSEAPPPGQAAGSSRMEGQVLSDADSSPLRRARVTLHPLEAGLAATTVEADDRGNYSLRNIAPGTYSISAQRDGYLESSVATRNGLRLPRSFSLGKDQTITGVTFRLRPWGVITGAIHYDDGEPAIGIRVDLYRQYRSRGRVQFQNVAAAVTNDRGEYRVHNLPPGEYYVAAVYERNTQQAQPAEEQPPADAQGRELPVFGYATTFFPDTLKLSEATPVKLDYGREIGGIDLFLQQTRKAKLRGRVTNGLSGGAINATLYLTRLDAGDNGVLSLPVRASFDKDGNFEIRNVAPGPYELWAEASVEGKRLIGRRPLTVSGEDVEGLEVVAVAASDWTGTIRVEGGESLPNRFTPRVRLEPRSERGLVIDVPAARSPFPLTVMPNEVYDVFAVSLPGEFYVSRVTSGGNDVRKFGLQGSAASQTPFEIVIDSRGGQVTGRVFDSQGLPISGANLILIPDPPDARLQDYRDASADEYGQFAIHGVAPGKYILSAWLDEPPCDFYNPDALEGCRNAGVSVGVKQAGEEIVTFTVKQAK